SRSTERRRARKRRAFAAVEHHRAALFRGRSIRRSAAGAASAASAAERWAANAAAAAGDVLGSLVEETDRQRSALDNVAVGECLLPDTRVVDVRTVRAAEILDDESPVLHADLGVPARHHAVVGANRALETAADIHGLCGGQLDRTLAPLTVPEKQTCH